jgi:hypothetical protein
MTDRLDRRPGATLARIGTSTRATVDRIVDTYRRATPTDTESGARWYGDAGSLALEIARAGGTTAEHAAAVIAHLSPRTPWQRNVSGAWSLVLTGDAPGCLGRNVSGARRALESDRPLATLGGPKTQRFARNILGDRDAVTVDVWAARVALGERDDLDRVLTWAGVYDALEHCYRLAARRLGVDPVTVQATTWIVARNGRAA